MWIIFWETLLHFCIIFCISYPIKRKFRLTILINDCLLVESANKYIINYIFKILLKDTVKEMKNHWVTHSSVGIFATCNNKSSIQNWNLEYLYFRYRIDDVKDLKSNTVKVKVFHMQSYYTSLNLILHIRSLKTNKKIV